MRISASLREIFSVEKVSHFFFGKNLVYLNESLLGDLEPSYACVNFSRLSIASVDSQQHLSEVVFSFHCKENDRFRVVPVHPGLTGYAGLHKQWPWLHEHHNHWWRVLGVRPGTRHFPYYENPTRALNTTSLKCCLPSTFAIDRGGKLTHAYEG